MSMTFLEQQDLLSELLGDPGVSTSDAYPSARRVEALNRGELMFAIDSKSLKGYATGTVASNTLTLPTDWVETYVLVVDNKNITNRREMSLTNWEDNYQGSSDDPIYYVWDVSGTKTITFMSTAGFNGKTYYIWYFRKPTTALSADSDESIIPNEYREASSYWAAHRLFQQIGKNELSNRMYEQYVLLVNKATMRSDLEYVNHTRPVPEIVTEYPENYTSDRQGQGYNIW